MTGQPRIWSWGDSLAPLESALASDGMLVIPTESTYGLAVDPRNGLGVDSILRFKRRPSNKALPVVVAEIEQLAMLGGDPEAPDVMEIARLWPAPLTLVIEIERPLPASADRCSLAIRIPAHAGLRSLLSRLGRPLTATSANPGGQLPVSSARMLVEMLGGWNCVIVDDGDLVGGPVSTIVRLEERGFRILRHGAVSLSWLQERVSRPVFSAAPAEISADDLPRTP